MATGRRKDEEEGRGGERMQTEKGRLIQCLAYRTVHVAHSLARLSLVSVTQSPRAQRRILTLSVAITTSILGRLVGMKARTKRGWRPNWRARRDLGEGKGRRRRIKGREL